MPLAHPAAPSPLALRGPQEIMKEWTKEVLRAQPTDIYAWSAKYFAEKAAANAGAGGK